MVTVRRVRYPLRPEPHTRGAADECRSRFAKIKTYSPVCSNPSMVTVKGAASDAGTSSYRRRVVDGTTGTDHTHDGQVSRYSFLSLWNVRHPMNQTPPAPPA